MREPETGGITRAHITVIGLGAHEHHLARNFRVCFFGRGRARFRRHESRRISLL
jgi:hypothetical protein